VAESFDKAKQQIADYCESIYKPFNVSYNNVTQSIEVDKRLKTRPDRSGEGGLEF
jgi:hypothetical protein